jgi:hypothetical protein
MKLFIVSFLLFSFVFGSTSEPNYKELQEMVEQMKEAYGIIEENSSNSSNFQFDLEKNYSEQELKEKVDQMKDMLESDPVFKKYYQNKQE